MFRGVLQQADLRVLPTPGQFGEMLRQGAPLVCCVGAVISAVFAATNLATGAAPCLCRPGCCGAAAFPVLWLQSGPRGAVQLREVMQSPAMI